MLNKLGIIFLLSLLFALLTPPLFYAAAHGEVAWEFFTKNFFWKTCGMLLYGELIGEIFIPEHDISDIPIHGFLTNLLGYFVIFGGAYSLFFWASKGRTSSSSKKPEIYF